MAEKQENIYPLFDIKPVKKPSKFYAVPLVGFVVKMVMLIPVFIELIGLFIAWFVLWVINSCVIAYSGEYWDTAYKFNLGIMRYYIKMYLFILGLTDTYPGFSLEGIPAFELNIKKPHKPNKLFAFPIVGILIRLIAIIPYNIFRRVMMYGLGLCFIVAWYPILADGDFPLSLFEFEQDALTISLREFCFLNGLIDSYPSFHIALHKKPIKITLLILGSILVLMSLRGPWVVNTTPVPARRPVIYRPMYPVYHPAANPMYRPGVNPMYRPGIIHRPGIMRPMQPYKVQQ